MFPLNLCVTRLSGVGVDCVFLGLLRPMPLSKKVWHAVAATVGLSRSAALAPPARAWPRPKGWTHGWPHGWPHGGRGWNRGMPRDAGDC